MKGIYLLLGSNLGDRLSHLQQAVRLLELEGLKISRQSTIYETAPWGNTDQPSFLNAVVEVVTERAPQELLAICLLTENALGRVREVKWGARNIDIDILFYRDLQLMEDDLLIPHPGIPYRRFTLLPLCDLIPDEYHPVTGQSLKEMLYSLPDDATCQKTNLVLGS